MNQFPTAHIYKAFNYNVTCRIVSRVVGGCNLLANDRGRHE